MSISHCNGVVVQTVTVEVYVYGASEAILNPVMTTFKMERYSSRRESQDDFIFMGGNDL